MSHQSQRHLDARSRMDPRWFMEIEPDRVKHAEFDRNLKTPLLLRIRAALVRLLVG